MKSTHHAAHDLVDMAEGEISREIFVNEDIYQEEKERIFTRAWLYVGHESQIKNPGDFVVSKMGEESVILVRDTSGKIHVFLNSCAHRGMRVCRYDEGNTRAFKCPYHAWTYKTDGTLIGVQDYDHAYQPPFEKSKWGLVEVAQLANYMGTIWATWDKTAPSFDDYLGEATVAFDQGLCAWDGGDGGTELLGSTQKWIVPCNWKFVAENFSGDWLHGVSHRSVDMIRLGPSGEVGRRDDFGDLTVNAFPQGHGILYSVYPPNEARTEYAMSPATSAYFQECWGASSRENGRRRRGLSARWHDISQYVLSRSTAAHAVDLPSDGREHNGNVAHVFCRQSGAGGGETVSARVLHALFRPRRHD